MGWQKKSALRVGVVFSILMSASACNVFGRAPQLEHVPALDPRDEAECTDPGVGAEAIVALAENRVALADCARRHANVVRQYNDVRQQMGEQKEPR